MESKEFQKQNSKCTNSNIAQKTKTSTSGITLIALIVTIIVLLILAGISINLILGENGIITKASMAKEAQEKAQLKEEAELVKATGLAENLSKVDGEYGKADLLEDLNNNFEGSTLGSDRITTSDGKYDIIVDDDLNITVEKNGEADNIKAGRIIITSNVVQEDTDTYIELYFEIEGKKKVREFAVEYINTNIYPDINDSAELETIITNKYGVTFNNQTREFFKEEADRMGVTYLEILKYYIFDVQIEEEAAANDNVSNETVGIITASKLNYGYWCYYLGEEEYTVAEDIEKQALRIFNKEGTFDEAVASIGTSKAQLQQRAEAVGATYEQYLRYMIAITCDDMYKINVNVSNGLTTRVSLIDGFWSFNITEAGEYIINAEIVDGKKGETTVVIQESEVLDPDGWEVAWTCTDGTNWSEQITNDGTTVLPTEGVIAKLYNTGNTITPQLPEYLGGSFYDEGPEYKLVFEGSGNMGSLDVDEHLNVWLNTQYSYYVSEVIICEGITNIAEDAFFLFVSLETIEMPKTIENIGEGAFYLCHKLTGSIKIPEEMTSIGEHTFFECGNITEVIVHDGITSIGEYAFKGCKSITNISIPKNVTYIGRDAFNGTDMAEITIPDGVTEILYATFANCANLTSVTIPSSVTTINEYAFENCTKLTSIVIPNTVETIGTGIFKGCSELASVKLSSNISLISAEAFEDCTKLKTITIPSNITSIRGSAFKGCTSLEKIIIPDSVTEMSSGVFENCISLASVTLSNNISSIGDSTFENCSALNSITIPSKVTWIWSSAFKNCSALTSIIIPSEVGHIESSAFENCLSLKSVTILTSDYITIGNNAFMGLPANSYIYVPNSTIKGDFIDGTNYDSTKTTIQIK